MELNRVVITGMGALTPLGNDVPTYWSNLLAGVSGAAPITRFDASEFSTQFACEVKNFDGEAYFGRKESRRTDPFCQYALAAVDEAIRDGGVDFDQLDRNRVGVLWASALGGITTTEEQIGKYESARRADRFSPFYIPKMLIDASSGAIAMRHGLHGVNYNAISACASSNAALIDAGNYIRLGKADMMISGGSEAAITPTMLGGFAAAKALSKRNGDPQSASRPFDSDRDGFVMAEGAGALILESLEHAIRRDAPIYAEIVGGGISADAYHATAAHPEGLGAILSMQSALAEANLKPTEIDYLNAHATSTPVGDISEISALSGVMGDDLGVAAISATKSMTGHLLGAAGAVEAIATLLAMRDNQIPPTINLQQMDTAMPDSANIVHGDARRQEVNVGMSNSFGFGGHNATIIFRTLD